MSLRIHLTARRCNPEVPGRVRFLLGNKAVTPEGLVLGRWKARSQEPSALADGVTFDGCRLPPGTWRVLLEAERRGLSLVDANSTRRTRVVRSGCQVRRA